MTRSTSGTVDDRYRDDDPASRAGIAIRHAEPGDRDAIAGILLPVIRAGETYALDRDLGKHDALAYWLGPDHETFVALAGGAVVGTYYLHRNQAGGGRHVCNCGYVVRADRAGHGIGRRMCEHSLAVARAHGYRAMRFNFVIATNTRAVALWTSLGFDIAGRLPGAFRHPRHGYVDALVMYQPLVERTAIGPLGKQPRGGTPGHAP